jgi:hypothetical protein
MNFALFPGSDLELVCLLEEWGANARPSDIFPLSAATKTLQEGLLERMAGYRNIERVIPFVGTAKLPRPFLPSRIIDHNFESLAYRLKPRHIPKYYPVPGSVAGPQRHHPVVRLALHSQVICLYPGRFQEKVWVKDLQ